MHRKRAREHNSGCLASTATRARHRPRHSGIDGIVDAWHEWLTQNDAPFAALQAELAQGRRSEAMQQYRTARSAALAGLNALSKRRDGTAVTPSHIKYQELYRVALPAMAPQLFGAAAQREGEAPRFLDVGAAPGGLCAYLCGELGWRGVAYSLSPASGGFEMLYSSPRCAYNHANLAVAEEWRRVHDEALATGGDAEQPFFFRFVNLGIVLDEAQQEHVRDGAAADADADAADAELEATQLSIFRNELLLGLACLDNAGALMLATPTSWRPIILTLLCHLTPCFASVRVTPTFASERSAVYVLFQGFAKHAAATVALSEALLATDPLTITTAAVWQPPSLDRLAACYETVKSDLQGVWASRMHALRSVRESEEVSSLMPSASVAAKFKTSLPSTGSAALCEVDVAQGGSFPDRGIFSAVIFSQSRDGEVVVRELDARAADDDGGSCRAGDACEV